ncbi:hypothetical protein PISMIDRAFT_686725 [Pisolithus microcarpus 441]|uniref:Protein transport protein SEC23 n=1 Tax=Pisolithus microcarpus 441 TaxID=765257 RepID=A0A0C9YQK1_9AGAM|nr:hypothetical protein BKA83DRAFT_686725 [Pisolithus microcarpus]KIK16049.1 hypothetical protein PISMIDRAFT_686725 [Pisolithus microcarpus 441]
MPWPTDVPVQLAPWLIPNPVNPYVPQLERDVSKHPSMARRVTGAHVTSSSDKRTLRSCFATPVADAQDLPVDRFHIPRYIVCDQGGCQARFSPSEWALPRRRCPLRRMAPRRAQHGKQSLRTMSICRFSFSSLPGFFRASTPS